MNLAIGLLDNSVSLLLFLLNLSTSAFIRADLRRQKANKETPDNVSVWELAGLKSGSHGWGSGTSPIVDWFCGGRETRSNLTNMAPGELVHCVLQHCFSAALSWVLSQLLLQPPCSGPQSMSLLSQSDEHSPLGS